MKVNVVWQSYFPQTPTRGYWDMTLLSDLFDRHIWSPVMGHDFIHRNTFAELPPDADGAVVVLPGQYHAQVADLLNTDISWLKWVLVILVGDECTLFPAAKLRHPNMKLWVQTPKDGVHDGLADRRLVFGYPQDTRAMLTQFKDGPRFFQWFFAGQITHNRRQECAAVLRLLRGTVRSLLIETEGFAQGIPHFDYYAQMVCAKFIPCPAGNATPDSFRVWEALEAGCIPIVDGKSPVPFYPGKYWDYVLRREPPFPVVDDWSTLPRIIEDLMPVWKERANSLSAWWQGFKREMVYWMEDDINQLANAPYPDIPGWPRVHGLMGRKDLITVIMPTSPIPSHPQTRLIEETLESVRYHLPESEILLMIDGVREEQAERKESYEKFKSRLLWKCNHEWKNVLPVVFDSHQHQANMTRATLEMVKTPFLLFVEHDTPLVTTKPIDWEGLIAALIAGDTNMVRFHYDVSIYDGHRHLMLDDTGIQIKHGVPLIRTIQWSQRPHLASVAYYKSILSEHFSTDSRTMIEDKMHGILQSAWDSQLESGWNKHKTTIYAPDGDMQRSRHLDGRESDEKFEMRF